MTTNNEAFEKFIAELDFQDIAHDTESIRNLYLRAWQAATTEANKRIEALEGEVAESDFVIKQTTTLLAEICLILKGEPPAKKLYGYHDLPKMVRELKANINTLREALGDVKPRVAAYPAWCENFIEQTLSATPAESLQAHDDLLIEKCAKICESICNQHKDQYIDAALRDCYIAIRALKEVK